jgi:hypothetical protein
LSQNTDKAINRVKEAVFMESGAEYPKQKAKQCVEEATESTSDRKMVSGFNMAQNSSLTTPA